MQTYIKKHSKAIIKVKKTKIVGACMFKKKDSFVSPKNIFKKHYPSNNIPPPTV